MTILERYCVGSILQLISWLLVAWLFPEQAIGPAGRNMYKGAEGQAEDESRRAMIPFYQNSTNVPSTRQEAGLIIYRNYGCCTGWPLDLATAPLMLSIQAGGVSMKHAVCHRQSIGGSATFTFIQLSTATCQPPARLAGARVSHNLHSPVVLLPHHYYSRREPL